jgi:transposase-like protein
MDWFGMVCPQCNKSDRTTGSGSAYGRKRYKCKRCGITFYDPSSYREYTKRHAKWSWWK